MDFCKSGKSLSILLLWPAGVSVADAASSSDVAPSNKEVMRESQRRGWEAGGGGMFGVRASLLKTCWRAGFNVWACGLAVSTAAEDLFISKFDWRGIGTAGFGVIEIY